MLTTAGQSAFDAALVSFLDDGCMADYYAGVPDWPDDRPSVPPGRSFGPSHPLGNPIEVEAFLNQRERWVGADGPMNIADMTPGHALNAAALVRLRSAQIVLALHAAGYDALDLASNLAARRLVTATNLFKALMARASEEAEIKRSWER